MNPKLQGLSLRSAFGGVAATVVMLAAMAATVSFLGARAQTGAGQPEAVAAVVSCASLAGASLSQATDAPTAIAAAVEVSTPKGDFCRVTGTIQPAINFEVDLPIKAWTQRYLQTGCGGLCGNLNIQVSHAETCLPALNGEMVVASDDMGHQSGEGGAFGKDPQKRIDFAYRGNHVTALAAKALIKAFYGRAPRFSYFSGCSDGGREALVEAERFPDDFDGVAAGAPAMNFQVQNSFYHAWQARSNTGPDGKTILISDKAAVLHKAVLAACDELDGLKDGLISDPRACHFDPKTIQCTAGAIDTSACLSAAEVEAARRLYQGPRDSEGHRFTPGGPQYGSELAWTGVYVTRTRDEIPLSKGMASDSSTYVIFPASPAADGDIDHFAFTQKHFAQLATFHPLYDATDTDLGPFQAKGGKLILWHGWSDPHISPINTIAYYDGVKRVLGAQKTDAFARLFLFAGMYHCRGGDGFSQFDVLSPLIAWVEHGQAPDAVIASQVPEPSRGPIGPPSGAPTASVAAPPALPARAKSTPLATPAEATLRTRPVFAYPKLARYTGTGDVNDARNYVASSGPELDPAALKWEGARFMGPDYLRNYAVKDGKLTVVAK